MNPNPATTAGAPILQTFAVSGMTCGHCEKAVTRAVKGVDAQAEVRIELASGQVDVVSSADRARLAAAIVEEGYPVAA